MRVHHTEIDCIGSGDRCAMHGIQGRSLGIDAQPPFRGVGLAQEAVERNLAKSGVGDIPTRIGKGDAHGFDEYVPTLDAHGIKGSEIQALENVEGEESGKPLPVRRALPNPQTAVHRADRLVPG